MTNHPAGSALFTDLYELTMLQAYFEEGLTEDAVFSLFVRRLPEQRNFLVACGLGTVLDYLENFRFETRDLDYLASYDEFKDGFIERLRSFRFTGDVRAVPEGTPVFADEPILEVTAPLPEAQVVETFIMNQIHLQTVLASKAYRVVRAAAGRPVVDFGARRMHGTDAALKAARAFYIAGVTATSNVLAGREYGVPVTGTMAHSYIQAHENESDAFRAFTRQYPGTVLLVDTYDTIEGVGHVIDLAREMGDDFDVRAIRLDSGDLHELSIEARRLLDEAGLEDVEVFASGGLDEDKIADLVARGAAIDGFGVGTRMGVSKDAPSLDIAYKLSRYAGRDRLKLSTGKPVLPGRKQIFRMEENGRFVKDVIGRADEGLPGRPLLMPVMRGGERLDAGRVELEAAREHAREQVARLPEQVRDLDPADPPYPVEVSERLSEHQDRVAREARDRMDIDD